MAATLSPDLCVIGGGSGGLAVAAGAVQMGASVVLIERGAMGGDCLNYGCVPSKAMLAAGKLAWTHRHSQPFGVQAQPPQIDFAAVNDHIQDVIAGIAPHDSQERFESLGCTVIRDTAAFTDARTVTAGGETIRPKRVVVATGSRPAAPPVPGLAEAGYLTNETVFESKDQPDHLVVIGGGPIGCELAQAHRRLGSRVTVVEMARTLNRDDDAAAEVVRAQLRSDGIELREQTGLSQVTRRGERDVALELKLPEGGTETLAASHLLVAAGRKPNTEALNLPAAGIEPGKAGIPVDDRLRATGNKRVFAIGDVASGPQFTHWAMYHAGIVIRNALFRLPAKVSQAALPWVTYTEPELAQVGLTEAQAREQLGERGYRVLTSDFAGNDRARAERQTAGFVKAIVTPKGQVLGCTIAGAHAGELLLPWGIAIQSKLKVGAIANAVAPYPTLSEASKRAAGGFYTPSLFSQRTRKVVQTLLKLG